MATAWMPMAALYPDGMVPTVYTDNDVVDVKSDAVTVKDTNPKDGWLGATGGVYDTVKLPSPVPEYVQGPALEENVPKATRLPLRWSTT